MKKILNQLFPSLKKELGLYLSISFGVAFFVFIFKPFPLDHLDDDVSHLHNIGLGAIIFLIIFLVRAVYPNIMQNKSESHQEPVLSSVMYGFIIWFSSTVIISFYLIYSTNLGPSPYLVLKVILICIAPPVILSYYDKIGELKLKNEILAMEGKIKQKNFEHDNEENLSNTIELYSENLNEKFTVSTGNILFIRSANNYAEINYIDEEQHKKKLLRNTLRNIEIQLKPIANFIRCHRICIVNTHHIEKLGGNCNRHTLILKGYDEDIPVSRQYFIKIKEAL